MSPYPNSNKYRDMGRKTPPVKVFSFNGELLIYHFCCLTTEPAAKLPVYRTNFHWISNRYLRVERWFTTLTHHHSDSSSLTCKSHLLKALMDEWDWFTVKAAREICLSSHITATALLQTETQGIKDNWNRCLSTLIHWVPGCSSADSAWWIVELSLQEGGQVGGNDFWEKEPQQLVARQIISMCESDHPFWIVTSLQNH